MNLKTDPFVLFKTPQELEQYTAKHADKIRLIKKHLEYHPFLSSTTMDFEPKNLENFFSHFLDLTVFFSSNSCDTDYSFKGNLNHTYYYQPVLLDAAYTIHWLNTCDSWITLRSLASPLVLNDDGLSLTHKPNNITKSFDLKAYPFISHVYQIPGHKITDTNFSKNLKTIIEESTWQEKFIIQEKVSNEYLVCSFLPNFSRHLSTIKPSFFAKILDNDKSRFSPSKVKNFLKILIDFSITLLVNYTVIPFSLIICICIN